MSENTTINALPVDIIMNTVLDGLITIDAEGHICSFNLAAERIFQYTSEEVIGKKVNLLMPEPYHNEHDQYLVNYLRSGNKKVIGIGREVSAQRKDASIFPMELSVNEMHVDGKRMFVGTIRDISDRKRAEQQLLAKAQHLQAVMNTVPDGVITINATGVIQSFNPAAERIFGYTAEDVVGNNVKMLMPNPYYAEHDQYLTNYKDTGDKKIIGIGREVMAKRKDGTVFPIELGVNEMDVTGERLFVGTIHDISERKQAEEAILRSNMELERFAYVASHDLQEPLRMVNSFTQLLKKHYAHQLDERAVNYIQYASNGAVRMQALVHSLLDYARLSKTTDTYEDIDLNELKPAILEGLLTSIEQTKTHIEWQTLPTVRADPIRLSSVFQNLISNAIKYRKTDTKPVITIAFSTSSDNWVFSVTDNGIGMKQQYAEKIFEPFQRLHKKEEYPGTGVGLSICRKIIEDLGGKIWVVSELGKGSIFYFSLPKIATSK